MEKEVKGCNECPFSIPMLDYDASSKVNKSFDMKCWHPDTGINSFINEEESNNTYPDWCPLKQESITIKLK